MVVRGRLVQLLLEIEEVAEVAMSGDQVGINSQRLSKYLDRLIELVQFAEQVAEVDVGGDVLGIELQGAAEAAYRIGESALAPEGVTEVVVGLAQFGVGLNGLAVQAGSGVKVATIVVDHTQQTEGGGVRGLGLQDLPA